MAKENVVLGLIVKKNGESWEILLQERHVQDHEYDPDYDNTLECIGETLEGKESFEEALVRGLLEEAGVIEADILGFCSGLQFSDNTGKNIVDIFAPIRLTMRYDKPQPWYVVACYLILVGDRFVPNSMDDEAGNFQWFTPEMVIEKARSNGGPVKGRSFFMDLHYPYIISVAFLLSMGFEPNFLEWRS